MTDYACRKNEGIRGEIFGLVGRNQSLTVRTLRKGFETSGTGNPVSDAVNPLAEVNSRKEGSNSQD